MLQVLLAKCHNPDSKRSGGNRDMTEETAFETSEQKKARIWGMICHLSALVGLLGVPLGQIAGPLVIWIWKRKSIPFVDEQGKEALNFQISMTIYTILAALLILMKLGMFAVLLLAVINLVLVIIAGLRANAGETFRYPFKLRFIK
jgi:uncharacterized protein